MNSACRLHEEDRMRKAVDATTTNAQLSRYGDIQRPQVRFTTNPFHERLDLLDEAERNFSVFSGVVQCSVAVFRKRFPLED